MKITKSELKNMIREALREELYKANTKRIAYIDQTGSNGKAEYDLLARRLQADGFDGTVKTVEDPFMKELCADVARGYDVTLYTTDDDYTYNCADIVDAHNFTAVVI